MADSPSLYSSSTSASQSTKQLLDELDALMQRMLAVPVQPAETEAAPQAGPEPRQVELMPAPITPVVQAPPLPQPAAPAEPFLPAAAVPLVPIIVQRPTGVAAATPAQPRPPAPASPRAEQAAVQPLPKPRSPWMNPTATKTSVGLAVPGWGSRLLLAVNRMYDRGTDRLGPVGRWLRGETGRSLLGWTGLAMVVVALVWAAVLFLG